MTFFVLENLTVIGRQGFDNSLKIGRNDYSIVSYAKEKPFEGRQERALPSQCRDITVLINA